MTLGQICEFIAVCIVSAGGIGGIIIASIKFSADIIADRLAKKYELRLNKELEQYRGTMESKKYISKAMFDKEFEIYLSFNKNYADLYNNMQLYDGLLKDSDKVLSSSELYKLNGEQLLEKINDGEITTAIQMTNLEKKICEQILEFRNILAYSGAFIPHENWKLYQDLCNACHKYMLDKTEADFKLITVCMGKMQVELRRYLEQLVVIEGGNING